MNLDRIKKLLRLAADPGATEHEAKAAAGIAYGLLSADTVDPSPGKAVEPFTVQLHVTNVAFYVLAVQRRGGRLTGAVHLPDSKMELTFKYERPIRDR